MDLVLNEYELRVIGALVEKQIATPDYYPMTLNALVNACNQKNHRDPVVAYDEATVVRALDSLRDKKLAYTFHGSDSRVPKYGHLFPKAYELNEAETAVMAVLALRGPQTPGELRSRTAHLHNFENLPEVETTLQNLSLREKPLVVKLPRQAGSRESRFAHLIGGDINPEELAAAVEKVEAPAPSSRGGNERVAKLEEQVATLTQELNDLKQQFAEFRKQFE
ncbi:MAG TPA: YceH family protein [Blastocatellia bacterium]|nr:YceH family protein [Blastocatellia bacterium]HMV83639.1 YceH family protein [Blastocatellia bacterium]HMX28126.1 YceH family protein [Blastocatellia bacterium]HMZ20781.1 YceH family protein [Blastocatellia bacterium]HNG34267.1 YceH family protein [Blastocatellia bacterium]